MSPLISTVRLLYRCGCPAGEERRATLVTAASPTNAAEVVARSLRPCRRNSSAHDNSYPTIPVNGPASCRRLDCWLDDGVISLSVCSPMALSFCSDQMVGTTGMGELVRLSAAGQARQGDQERECPRIRTMLKAQIEVQGLAQPVEMLVRNLSSGGLMGSSTVRVRRGEAVTINLGRAGRVLGVIAWVDRNQFGVAFDREIDDEIATQPVAPVVAQPVLHHVGDWRRPGLRVR